ncbi:uncharacterized protein FIBRA_05537 [Fibroporia radiculosa]|uniref:RNA helicase n=1 Tax=Fibroporia radiculosa TaxID=599839 RepID=J4IAS2_9APHY|nr:uncharacterized protein FIBRA_05537 [Fibroporia radiculosa]CCM03406.1 predicted protein [Fibroporia radiculosa]
MDPIARSPALNPASTPFFPGGMRVNDDEGRGSSIGFRVPLNREQHYSTSGSTISLSPSEHRSMRSSPISLQDDRDRNSGPGVHLNSSDEGPRHSPASNQPEGDRTFSAHERQVARSMSGTTDSIPEGDDTPSPAIPNGQSASNISFLGNMLGRGRDRLNTPPVVLDTSNTRSSLVHAPFLSSSPASSLDSGSHFASSADLSISFDTQLRASPFVHDLIDRLIRCEYTSREIQRDLNDVHRKLDILVERTLHTNGPPEFKDPFAPAPASQTLFSSANGPRASMNASIAPNQPAPTDDISQISNRLNTLTTSVGQLLALQTQQMQAAGAGLQSVPLLPGNIGQGDLSSNQATPQQVLSTGSTLGHGLPGRPDMRPNPRMPNPPMRTWSAGNIDVPLRPADSSGPLNRQDTLFRDKRRSVSALMRRDSAGGENLTGGSSSTREGGPIITKWDQLALAPDLLRSLNTFGVGPPNKIQQRALPFLLRGADIIAQAPPTQERIAAYVIPAIHVALSNASMRVPVRGPLVVMISTTVDQATQAQRMIRDLGGPIGIKSALGVGSASAGVDLNQELRILQQNMPHIICGTPQKLHALFTSPGGMPGTEVRFLVLDEVDQLIARNLHEYVFNIIKLLPPPRSRPLGATSPGSNPGSASHASFSAFESNAPNSLIPPMQNAARRFSAIGLRSSPPIESANGGLSQAIERQTALFSNTVPQDVLNLAQAIQLREPVRVLVRRDGNVTHADTSQGARGLRQFYLYLAFTAGGRSDAPLPTTGLGIIGSGRGASSAETAQAREWKLEALADLFDDLDVPQAIIHVGGMTALDAVVYKLASRGLEAVPLHGDMNAGAKLAALNKFRGPPSGIMRQSTAKVLVVYDVQVKTPEVSQIPLIINYGKHSIIGLNHLPKAVEEYAHRVAPAIAPSYSRAGVIINFVTATGGDVEMLRSIECFYKIKCPEVPMSLRDIV